MTHFPFTVNGRDFSALVHKRGYETNRVPVFTKKITTLNGVDRFSLLRMRGVLRVTLNPADKYRMMELMEELQDLPVSVTYHCFQSGTVETETMVVQEMPLSLLLSTSEKDWVNGVTLTFEQM